MAGVIDYTVHFNVKDNFKEFVARVQSAASKLEAGGGSAGEMGALAQAAGQQAKQMYREGGLSRQDLKEFQASMRSLITEMARGSGDTKKYREDMGTGGYKRSVLEGPAPTGELGKQTRKVIGKASQDAALQEELAESESYIKSQKRATAAKALQAAKTGELLAGDDTYLGYIKRVSAAKAKEAAGVQEKLAVDDDYLGDVKRAAAGKAKEAAGVAEKLAGDDVYVEDVKRAAAARQKETAKVQTLLAGDDEYLAGTKKAAAARAKQAAGVQTMLAGDDDYLEDMKTVAAGKQKEAAGVQEKLTADGVYIEDTARLAIARQEETAKVQEKIAADSNYVTSTVRIAKARAQEEAKVQEELVGDTDYTAYTKRVVNARARQEADLQEQLAQDGAYATSTARIASARASLDADTQEQLAGDADYIVGTARVAIARKAQAADIQELLATDADYLVDTARVAIARRQQAAEVAELTATDGAYLAATSRVASARAVEGAGVQELLATDGAYIAATQRTAIARKIQEAQVQAGLTNDEMYKQATVAVAAIRKTQQANLQESLTTDPAYNAATKKLAIARQEQSANLQSALAGDPAYKEATARLSQARLRQQADVQGILAGDDKYKTATVDLTRAREVLKAKVAEVLAGDDGYKAATVRATIAREQQKADIQGRLAGDPAYAAATAATTAAREAQQAKIRMELATDQQYITATANVARAREEEAARVKLAQAGETGGLLLPGAKPSQPRRLSDDEHAELLARGSLVDRAKADRQAASVARLQMEEGNKAVAASIEKRIAEAQLAVVLRDREKAEIKAAIQAGELGGTRFQRLQAWASPTARAPEEFATVRQMAVQKTVTSAGYAVGGAASAALLFGTLEAVKEASKLQEQFAGLRGQMEAIGQANAFVGVREGIKGISNETGIASSEVAKFAARLLGVFNDPNRALIETESAMKLAVVSGTDLATMLEELVPIAQEFGVSIGEIGDLAVSIHDKFGIAEESTLHFLGEVAPLAEEAGLSIEDMGVIGATAANSMGKSITVAGEQFTKVLPTMQQNQAKILQIFRMRPETSGYADALVESFGKGETGGALKTILKSYNELDDVQQQNLIRVSGSRREWALLNGLFSNSVKLLNDMESAESGAAANKGALERRFEDVSGTLNRNVERIKEGFKNAIEGLLSSGLGDAFAVIGKTLETALGLVNLLIGAFHMLNEATKLPGFETGVLTPIIQLGGAILIANKLMSMFAGALKGTAGTNFLVQRSEDGLSASISRRAAATTEAEGTLVSDTTQKGANATATNTAAESEVAYGLAQQRRAAVMSQGFARWGAQQEADIIAANVAPAARGGLGGALGGVGGWLGGQVARSPLLTRAFSGARYGFSDTGIGAQADAAAAQTGAATGGGLLPVGVMVAIGAMQVKNARDEQSEKLGKQANELKEKIKRANDSQLQNIANQYNDFWDSVQQGIFNIDLPGNLAIEEGNRRKGAKGAAQIGALQKTGLTAKFVDELSDQAMGELNDYFSKSVEHMNLAADLGISTDKGITGQVIDKLTGSDFGAIIAKVPFGLGAEALKSRGVGKGKTDLSRDELKKILPEIQRRAEANDGEAADLAQKIETFIASTKTAREIRDAVDKAIGEGNVAKAIEDVGGMENFLKERGLYDPKGAYEAGILSRGEYIAQVQQRVKDLEKQLKGAPDIEKAQKEFDQVLREAQQIQDKVNLERVETLKQTAPMTEFKPKTKIFDLLVTTIPTLSIPAQLDKIPELIQGNWDKFQERLSTIQDPLVFAAESLKGVEIDPQTVVLQMTKMARDNSKIAGLLKEGAGYKTPIPGQLIEDAAGGETQDELTKAIAERAAREGTTFKEAFLKIAKEREAAQLAAHPNMPSPYTNLIKEIENSQDFQSIDDIVKFLAPPKELVQKMLIDQQAQQTKANIALKASLSGTSPYVAAQAQLQTANAELSRLLQQKANGTGGINIDAEIAQAQANVNIAIQQTQSVVNQTAAAMDNWAVVMANGDPVKETNARLVAAENALKRQLAMSHGDERDPAVIQARQAIQELRFRQIDNMNEIAKSAMELEAFSRSRNPFAAGFDALKQAEFALATAKGDAAQNQARLQIMQAHRNIEEAWEAILQSDAQLAVTLLEIKQDPVAAKKKEVEEAQRRLDAARARGAETAELNQLIGELAQKKSDAIDTSVSEQEDLINFMLEMGEITTAQAIERLKVERDKYEVRSKKWRDLQLKIESLSKGSKGDAQFNLPANIALPTLYEARRLNQSRAMGIGYMDNRQIALTFNVDGAQDPAAVSSEIMNALQGAMGGGQIYTPGVSVGAFN